MKKVLQWALLASFFLFGSVQAAAIDINTADAQTFASTLKGVGISKAEAIVAFRTAHGPFLTVDDLVLVKGIGLATVEKNRDSLTVKIPAR